MDWKRIKSILILALIVLNVLLAWTLYLENKDTAIDVLDRTQVIALLADKDVVVNPEIFNVNPEIDNISLTIQTYDVEFVKNVFDNHDDNDIHSTLTDVTQNNELNYETDNKVLSATYLSDEVVKTQVYALIEELGFALDDLYVKDIGHTGKKTIFKFGQKYNGFIIRDAYMIVKYNNENLLSFKRAWYDVVDTKNNKNNLITQEYALYEFIGQLYDRFPNRERALALESIQLVYQLSVNTSTIGVSELAEKGDPSIFWEIITSDGESYLIEANR